MKLLQLAACLLAPAIVYADVVVEHKTKAETETPTVDTAAYAAGDAIGGVMTFADLTRDNAAGAGLWGVVISSAADNDLTDMEIVISSATMTASNNAAFTPTDAQIKSIQCIIKVTANDDCGDYADNSVCYAAKQCAFATADGGSLYAVLVARAAITLAAVDDINVTLLVSQD